MSSSIVNHVRQVADVEHRFAFHAASTQEKRDEHTSVRANCRSLAVKFASELPDGREKSLAITKLEEAMFWANAAIARQSEATKEPGKL